MGEELDHAADARAIHEALLVLLKAHKTLAEVFIRQDFNSGKLPGSLLKLNSLSGTMGVALKQGVDLYFLRPKNAVYCVELTGGGVYDGLTGRIDYTLGVPTKVLIVSAELPVEGHQWTARENPHATELRLALLAELSNRGP